MLLQVREREPQRPRTLNPHIDPDLETICLKAMAKKTGSRYATAAELAGDLERYLAGEPIEARPVGRAERVWRWCRRNPAVAAASVSGVVAFAALAALSVGSVLALQLNDAKQDADTQRDRAEEQHGIAEQKGAEADKQRGRADRLATTLTMERGLALCEQGNAARGMLWLARSLEMAPAHAADLQRASRASLAGWGRQIHPLRHLLQQKGQVLHAAFSPDGKSIVTGTGEGTAQLWDAATGQPRGAPFFQQKDVGVWRVAFSPDGKTIMTASGGGGITDFYSYEIRLWEASSAKLIGAPIPDVKGAHFSDRSAAAFSPDGKTLVTIVADKSAGIWKNKARLWEVATLKPTGSPIPNVMATAFSPDGKTLMTAGEDMIEGKRQAEVRLWDVSTGKPLGAPMRHEGSMVQMGFSPDGKVVATSAGSTARLWDGATGEPRGLSMELQEGLVKRVAFTPDGKTFITGSGGFVGAGEARLWEAATGKPLGLPMPHEREVFDLAVSPDGKSVLTGSTDGTARLWDASTGKPIGAPLQHPGRVWAVAFSPDGKTVLTTSQVLAGGGRPGCGKWYGQSSWNAPVACRPG